METRRGAPVIAELANLVRWEWFKLRRRWMPWILLALLVLVTQLSILGTWFAFNLSENIVDAFPSDASSRLQALDLDCGDVLDGRGPSVSRLQGPGVSQAQAERCCGRWRRLPEAQGVSSTDAGRDL